MGMRRIAAVGLWLAVLSGSARTDAGEPRPIPDDPPPHEGAWFEDTYLIRPPDLIVVEVLEALPGRPISGERLVRPDGKISLGFYGEVSVIGLTPNEAKARVVEHLRSFLDDEKLGLEVPTDSPFYVRTRKGSPPRLLSRRPEEAPKPASDGKLVKVSPAETDRVFLDVTAYNSKYYYVQGDVGAPGKLPVTGSATVLEAIHFVGGLTPTADPTNIRLVRPRRGDRPIKVYEIDYTAILKGDRKANLQLFDGDRLLVGRKSGVDNSQRVQEFGAQAQQLSQVLKSVYELKLLVNETSPGDEVARNRAAVNAWVDRWLKSLEDPKTSPPDAAAMQELVRTLIGQKAKPEK